LNEICSGFVIEHYFVCDFLIDGFLERVLAAK